MSTANPTGSKILIVEDDQGVRESLVVVLSVHGYSVRGVERGEEALSLHEAGPGEFDLIILDLNLPGIDGVETCVSLRAQGYGGPVLMLTARQEPTDYVAGLDSGADDYLAKPFALDELLARVRALLRGFESDLGVTAANGRLRLGDLWLDRSSRQVWRGDLAIDLTKIEFDLLELLMSNAERVLDRHDIQIEIWGWDEDTSSNTLEVFISGLRKKLEVNDLPRLIHTKRGVGYVARVRP